MPSSTKATKFNAVERLRGYLRGRTASEIKDEVHETRDGPIEAVSATVEPAPEKLTPLNSDDLAGFSRNVGIADRLIASLLGPEALGRNRLKALDDTFASWLSAEDKLGFSSQAVVAVLGAAFGQYCIDTLDMEWTEVEDSTGICIAVIGRTTDVRSYPFSMIEKRLESLETGFMTNVYAVLKSHHESGLVAKRGA